MNSVTMGLGWAKNCPKLRDVISGRPLDRVHLEPAAELFDESRFSKMSDQELDLMKT